MINLQELFCHLQNYHIAKPNKDRWESFIEPLKIFFDCWFCDCPTFEVKQGNFPIRLVVKLDKEIVLRCTYDENEEFPLCMETLENRDRYIL